MWKGGERLKYDVIVIGSATVDVFVKTDAETIDISGFSHGHKVNEHLIAYPLGSKILIKELDFKTGGGGTNVVATFAAQGLKTGYIGKIGQDQHGHAVFDWLKKNNVTFLGQVGGQTGYSVILDSQAKDRTILTFKGANNELEYEKLNLRGIESTWLFGCVMLGQSYETLERLFRYAKNDKMRIAWVLASYIAEKGIDHIKESLRKTEVLILNKEEAEQLVGVGTCLELAERLSKFGPKLIAVTDGEKGATIRASGKWGDERFCVKPATDLNIIETTGAGDAFAAGFVTGIIQGRPLKEAALQGIINSEGVIQSYGAKEHIADKKEMEELLRAEKENARHKIEDI